MIKIPKTKLKNIASKHVFFDSEGYWLPEKLNHSDKHVLFSLLDITKGDFSKKAIKIVYNLVKDKDGNKMFNKQFGDFNKVYELLKKHEVITITSLIDEISLSYGEELKNGH